MDPRTGHDRNTEDSDSATHEHEGRKVLGMSIAMFFPVVILLVVAIILIIWFV